MIVVELNELVYIITEFAITKFNINFLDEKVGKEELGLSLIISKMRVLSAFRRLIEGILDVCECGKISPHRPAVV